MLAEVRWKRLGNSQVFLIILERTLKIGILFIVWLPHKKKKKKSAKFLAESKLDI